MKITEKDMVHKALKCCRDGNSCSECPYRSNSDCIEILEHLATELYMADHPEIFGCETVENAETVEVIKCKDCTWWDKWFGFPVDGRGDCQQIGLSTDCNDFCSMAVRKGEENET